MCLQNINLKWKLKVCQLKEDFQQERDDGINIHVVVFGSWLEVEMNIFWRMIHY